MTGPRIALVDDHPLLAHGLQAELVKVGFDVPLVKPTSRAETVADIVALRPTLALIDLDLPIENGGLGLIEDLARYRGVTIEQDAADGRSSRSGPALTVATAVVTGSSDRSLWARSLESGARVVIAKTEPLDDIIDVVRRLAAGEEVRPHQRVELADEYRRLTTERADKLRGFSDLSRREGAVLSGLMNGLSPRSLAQRDCVSVDTVRSQIKSLLSKLHVNSQLAAVARAYEAGWDPAEHHQGHITLDR